MKYSALIGNPTAHSVSHILYEELAKAAKLKDSYKHLKVDVTPEQLDMALKAFNTLGFVGLNVTLPYKTGIIPLLDSCDAESLEMGAVNTIKLGQRTKGFNTDWKGIIYSLERFSPRLAGNAVIFGNGGAARAAIHACKQLKLDKIDVLYRTDSEGAKLEVLRRDSKKLGISLHTYEEAETLVRDASLIINATSAGMAGKNPLSFDTSRLDHLSLKDKTFLDAVFKPLETPLIKYFKSRGALTIDGLWMMIYQGVGAYGIWMDKQPDIPQNALDNIHALLEKELNRG